jgi:hypothetical protein
MEDNKLEFLIVKIGLVKVRVKRAEGATIRMKLSFFFLFFLFFFPFFLHRFSPPLKRTTAWYS